MILLRTLGVEAFQRDVRPETLPLGLQSPRLPRSVAGCKCRQCTNVAVSVSTEAQLQISWDDFRKGCQIHAEPLGLPQASHAAVTTARYSVNSISFPRVHLIRREQSRPTTRQRQD